MKKTVLLIALFALLTLLLPLTAFILPQGSAGTGQSAANAASFTPQSTAKPADTSGMLLILNEADGTVMNVTEREFVIGAMAAEMPATWPDEALKAQGIAAHSYALALKASANPSDIALKGAYFKANPSRKEGFLTDAVQRLVWGEAYAANRARLEAIADSILNEIVLFDAKPALACYHAISNGVTEASENVWGTPLAYLVSVDSTLDLTSPDYAQSVQLTRTEVYEDIMLHFAGIKLPDDPTQWFAKLTASAAGYVHTAQLGDATVTGPDLRKALNLRSAAFTVSYADDVFTFTTHGYGHGVGMSQYGACSLARTGKTYAEILAHYYPGTTLGTI